MGIPVAQKEFYVSQIKSFACYVSQKKFFVISDEIPSVLKRFFPNPDGNSHVPEVVLQNSEGISCLSEKFVFTILNFTGPRKNKSSSQVENHMSQKEFLVSQMYFS